MTKPSVRALASVLLLTGCASSAPSRSATQPVRTESTRRVARPRPYLRVPEEAMITHREGLSRWPMHATERRFQDAHGVNCVVVGGQRGVVHNDGSVQWSRSALSDEVRNVYVVREGVMFLARNGTLVSAPGCADEPVFSTVIGAARPLREEWLTRGELFGIDPQNTARLMRFGYAAQGKLMDPQESLGIVSLGVASPTRYELLLEGSVRMHSEDAGEHWTRMAPTSWTPMWFQSDPQGLMLVDAQDTQMFPVLEQGALGDSRVATRGTPTRVEELSSGVETLEVAAPLYPEVYRLLPRDAKGLHWDRRGVGESSRFVGVESSSGRVMESMDASAVAFADWDTWALGLVFQNEHALYVRDAHGELLRTTLSSSHHEVLVSSDRAHLYWRGTCEVDVVPLEKLSEPCCEAVSDTESKLCHWSADAAIPEVLSIGSMVPVVASGDTLGVLDQAQQELVVYNRADTQTPLATLPVWNFRAASTSQFGVTADGMYWAVVPPAIPDPGAVSGGARTSEDLDPFEPNVVTYSQTAGRNVRRLLGAGISLESDAEKYSLMLKVGSARNAALVSLSNQRSVWISNDGFASWRKLDFGGVGPVGASSGVCNSEGCLIDLQRVWFSFGATQLDLPARLSSGSSALGFDAVHADENTMPDLRLQCARSGMRPSARVAATQGGEPLWNGWILGASRGSEHEWRSGPFAWNGMDDKGAFGTSRGHLTIPSDARLIPIDVAREGLLSLRCHDANCDLSLDGLRTQTLATFAVGESRLWSDFRKGVWMDDVLVSEVLDGIVGWIDPRGGTAGMRTFASSSNRGASVVYASKYVLPVAHASGPVRGYRFANGRRDILVVSRALGTDREIHVPFDPTMPVETGRRLDWKSAHICTQPPVARAAHTYLKMWTTLVGDESFAMLEERPEGSCLRAVIPPRRSLSDPWPRVYRYTAQNGRLVGTLYGAMGRAMGTETCLARMVEN